MQTNRASRFLIVNADDFGQTAGVNRGIIEAHERGIVTSASLMVRQPGATEAAEYARAHPELSVGLHFELGEWRYVRGEWKQAFEVIDARDSVAIRSELERQLARFEELLGREPTHLDSHQHVHHWKPARPIVLEMAERRRISIRGLDPFVTYCGSFYGQAETGAPFPQKIAPSHLIEIMRGLSPGWTELGCHPGYAEGLDSVYLTEREAELHALCSEQVREELEQQEVRLRSFHDLQRATPGTAPRPAG